jgi:hypothetical protein
MGDSSSRTCGYCKVEREWNWNGLKLKDGSKIYTDGVGNRWAGRRCPICEKSRVASAVRHDNFDRDMIFQQLNEKGFLIKSKTHPVLAEKGGQTYQVGIRRARMDGANIIVESQADDRDDIVALVFESVRLVTPDQLHKMSIYAPTSAVQDNVASDRTSLGIV